MLERNGNIDDCMDDEMEMTEFYTGAGSQSVDCEASPPPALQVVCVHIFNLYSIFFLNNSIQCIREEVRNRISLLYQLMLVTDYDRVQTSLQLI